MKIELRPLDLGEVLDRTIQIFRSRFRMFVGIVAVGAVILLACQATQLILARTLRPHYSLRTFQIANGALSVLLGLFIMVVYSVVLPAMYRAVADMYTGVPAGVKASYDAVRRHWFRYVCLYIATTFVSIGPVILPGIALFVGVIAAARLRAAVGTGGLIAIDGTAGLLLAVAVGFSVWLGLRYALAGPACVFENIGVVQSFRRSAVLTKGQRLRLIILAMLMSVIGSAIGALVMVPVFPFMMLHHSWVVPITSIAALFSAFFSRILTYPLLGIGCMVCYCDARIRREGFDVEWMLQHSAGSEAIAEIALPISHPEITGLDPA